VPVPVTLKIRTGYSRAERNAVAVARIAEAAGVAALAVHGRTREDHFTGEAEHHTCNAAIGFSIAAGAEDGVAVAFIEEGIVYGDLPKVTLVPEDQECHEEKTILLPVGRMQPYPWSPTILPAQVLRLGTLAIVPAPFEITTISGRRIRAEVLAQLAPAGVTRAVMAGLSNGYSSYVATRDEYKAQHYEGAFTQFGPWTQAAWQQNFSEVAEALRDGTPLESTGTPLDLSDKQIINVPGVVADSPCALPDAILCIAEKFGDVLAAPPQAATIDDHAQQPAHRDRLPRGPARRRRHLDDRRP
jgi:neutral ceramidase